MRLGREVDHRVGVGHQAVDQGLIGHIALDEPNALTQGVQRLTAGG